MVCDQIHYPNNYLDSFPYIEHLDHYSYPEHDASWEPEGNLQNAQDCIATYQASRTMPEGGGVM